MMIQKIFGLTAAFTILVAIPFACFGLGATTQQEVHCEKCAEQGCECSSQEQCPCDLTCCQDSACQCCIDCGCENCACDELGCDCSNGGSCFCEAECHPACCKDQTGTSESQQECCEAGSQCCAG